MYSDYIDPMMLRIWPTQPQKFSKSQELIYKDWTPQTKEAVLWSLMATALESFIGDSRGLDVIEGRLTPYEKNPDLAVVHLIKHEDKYETFGYGSTIVKPDGSQNTMGCYWELSHASAPLPPSLAEIFKRY